MGNKKSKVVSTELTQKQLALLLANTNFSEYEIRQWHAVRQSSNGFLRDCPDGRLGKKKFAEVYQQLYPAGDADTYCKYAFDAFDKNDDGFIGFDEFLLAIAATGRGELDERLSLAFDIYDISDDGMIDQKELTKMLDAMYDLVGQRDRGGDQNPKQRAAEIMGALDISGDRKMNKEEFISGCKNDPYIHRLLAPNTQ